MVSVGVISKNDKIPNYSTSTVLSYMLNTSSYHKMLIFTIYSTTAIIFYWAQSDKEKFIFTGKKKL